MTRSKPKVSKSKPAKPRKSPRVKPKLNPIEARIAREFDRATEPKAKKTPNFYDRVYAIVAEIPRGKVTTYGAIAETLGMKGSSRLVGNALNAVPAHMELPTQRVINRIGALSGAHHFGGYREMRRLLEREGVKFKGELVDMEWHFIHPNDFV